MGVLPFHFEVVGAERLSFELKNAPIQDWSEAWPDVIEYLETIEAQRFALRGARGSDAPWAGLTERTLQQKLRKWGEQPIEVASGAMRDSLLPGGSGDTLTHMWPKKLEWGTNVRSKSGFPYPIAQQTGFRTRLGTGKAPVEIREGKTLRETETVKKAFVEPRKIIGFSPEEDRPAITRILGRFMQNKFRRRGWAVAKEAGVDITPGQARIIGQNLYEQAVGNSTPVTGDALFGAG